MQNAAALALAVALLVGALLTACTGKLAVMNEPPGMEFPPEKRTALMEVDCKAIRDPNVCTRTPGYAWVDRLMRRDRVASGAACGGGGNHLAVEQKRPGTFLGQRAPACTGRVVILRHLIITGRRRRMSRAPCVFGRPLRLPISWLIGNMR